ncbi:MULTISPECIES: ABC transporter substrate-binding protein [Micromonospora]|uniref:ABC transporter substrate-binding protein n=1 Tax=Micromonospora sicca TaxID=2202420 RepID=A0A317DHC5_9ACTN|nr:MULTISPECIES: ABC transporter substrate-binding protein [unclassified Micromonospora]MBM0224985.1 ABC transporter substrate-binding protein [Micromonospora sp. ATA51]MDZ5441644.1 ABC transporter substrate-binding protein [Micromonospora sp. 4G57]MDZ5490205.1 ABC transporter substrate-binding protein [Micromonospora sp. 4G53]PWR12225.1 ABC transporter substrate-binding protein [Micromonospora sp. 4G51]
MLESTVTRRGLLAAGAGLAALLAGCGRGGDPAAPVAKPTGGPWSFTDDRGEKVSAASRPARIVAFTGVAAALVDFGLDEQIAGVFGETRRADGSRDPQAGDLDVEGVEILGNAWGEFNLERYATLRPDLLVTHMYDPGALWYVPDESRAKILPLAPTVALTTARVPMTRPIERYAQLAESLGADLSAKKVTDARARFAAAGDAVRAAVKANPGIRVLAASGSPDLFYVSNPKISTDLMYFAELGVDIVVPTKLAQGDYFESLSWENAGKFPADLILLDNRGTALQAADLARKPTWAQLPAVRAGQVAPWDAVPRFSYAGAAPLLENLATAIRGAKKVAG